MIRNFVYTIKLVVQHKLFGTLDYLTKDFDTSLEINEDDYNNPFIVNSDTVLNMMATEVDKYVTTKNYSKQDIDIVSYEVVTNDDYVNIYFSEEVADNTHTTDPKIEVSIMPDSLLPSIPQMFTGTVSGTNLIEWKWILSGDNCAYRMYDQDDKVITEIGVGQNIYLETVTALNQNYARKLVAFNADGESNSTELVSIYMPAESVSNVIPLKEFALGDTVVREKNPVEKNIERLEAFHSGIGDNLDLLPQQVNEIRISEKFKLDVSLTGFKTQNVKLFTAIPFVYKLVATGRQNIPGLIDTDVMLNVIPWIDSNIKFKLESHVYETFTFLIDFGIDVSYTDLYGYERTKTIEYSNSFSISGPVVALKIKDLKDIVLQDADVSMATPGTVSIDKVYEIKADPSVTAFIDLENVLYATVKKTPTWYVYNVTKDITMSISDGQEMVLISPSDIVMKNSLGEIYDKQQKPATLITYLNVDGNVNITEDTDGLSPVLIQGHYPSLRAKLIKPRESYLISAKLNPTTTTYTKKIKDMFTTLKPDAKYTLEISPQYVKGNYTVRTTTDSNVDIINDKLYITETYNNTGTLTIVGTPSISYKAWELKSPNMNGTINGALPMADNGDGKKNYTIVATRFTIPSDVTDVTYSVEIVDSYHKLIDVHFRNEYSYNATNVNGDVITFSSDEYEFKDVYTKWTGAVIRTEEFIIATSDVMNFNAFVYNPIFDPTSQVMSLSEVKISCSSTNPNVFVMPVEEGIIDFSTKGFKEAFAFKAKILSPSQNAWSPTIHPGYYYINNDEYFLHANPYPEGMFSVVEEYVGREFLATIFATMETHNDVTDLSMKLTTKSSFSQGEKHEVQVNENGSINLIITNDNFLIDEYPEIGYYLTEPLGFGQSLDHLTITWDNTMNDDYIKGYVSVLPEVMPGEIAVWTDFEEVQNGVITIHQEPFTNFRVRMDLHRREHASLVTYNNVYTKQSEWWAIGSSITNMNIIDGLIEAQDNSQPASYTSPIYITEYPVVNEINIYLTVNHAITNGYEYELYYCTGDTKESVDEDTANWIRIYDLLERKHVDKLYRYKIKIPSGSNSCVYKVTSTFYGETLIQSSPILSNIVIDSNSPEWSIAKVITKTILCKVPMDKLVHPVTDYTIIDLIYPEILASGLKSPRIRSLKITTLDTSIHLLYDKNGESRLSASTDNIDKQWVKSDYINFDIDPDDSKQHIGYLYPVPKLGYPVIAVDDKIGALKHVSFMDDKGNNTLTNTETFISDGRDAVALGYDHIDLDTLKVTIDKKAATIKKVVDNMIYFVDDLKTGQEIKVSYMILNSFIVDYNEYVDVDRAKILVHLEPSATSYERIKIFYENNFVDNWYYANELELNPLYSDLNAGFIFLVDEIHEPKNITLSMNPDIFNAGSVDSGYLFVKVTDKYGNAVSDLAIQVKAKDGTILMIDNITNKFGIVSAKYFTSNEVGIDTITATCADYNLTVSKDVTVRRPAGGVFLTLTSDKYIVDSGYFTVTAKLFGENLVPFVAEPTKCILKNAENDVLVTDTKDTDINGECEYSVMPFINHGEDKCRIEITAKGVTEYIDIKVVN